MDSPDIPAELLTRFHRDLVIVHRLLGTYPTIARFLRNDPLPIRRVLDIGCGGGELLQYLRKRLGVDVVGIDQRPGVTEGVPMVTGDAVRDPLPEADVAVCTMLSHHLTPDENIAMIRNVARTSRRLLILDLIRHPLPLILFTTFLCPLIGKEAGTDGRQSIRRAYTPDEFRELVKISVSGMNAEVSMDIPRFRSRQVIDIRFTR
jgi:SAM-dependent methyltransferase